MTLMPCNFTAAINTNNNNTTTTTTSTSTSSTSASASVAASVAVAVAAGGGAVNVEAATTATTTTPTTRKRASSFIRKKPPLERGLSAQSALRVNKNAYVSEAPAPEVIVTRPSPEQQTHPLSHPHGHALSLRPDNATLVHVLVHRESEEYKEEEEEDNDDSAHDHQPTTNSNNCPEKPKPPQIRITSGSSESALDACLMPTVQIMVDSPKEPPRGDFSLDSASIPIDVDAPIDVNVQGDTSQVFYDYDPESNATDAAPTPTADQQR
ncbi:hypothetical protein ACLKA7_000494 [Drosophila subpalustris]